MSVICMIYFWAVQSELCLKISWSFSTIDILWDSFEIYAQDVPKICPIYTQEMPWQQSAWPILTTNFDYQYWLPILTTKVHDLWHCKKLYLAMIDQISKTFIIINQSLSNIDPRDASASKNPCNDFDISNPWQGKAMIGLGFDKKKI